MKKKVVVPAALLTAVLAAARYAILPLLSEKWSMRSFLIAATAWPLLCCSPALAQVGMLTPPLGATSSLGSAPGAPVGPNGLPPPAVSPEVSPVPNGVTGTINVPSTSSGMACSTVGISPSGLYGSTATYDGGGLPNGSTGATSGTMATPGTSGSPGISTSSAVSATSGVSTTSGMLDTSGLSGMCGSGSSSIAASSSPTTTSSPSTTTASNARAGVPLGSYEIGNLGVSSSSALPTTSVSPITGSVGSSAPSVPTMPAVSSATTSTTP
jgi:hypothetical protein